MQVYMPERDRESDTPASAELSPEFSALEIVQRLLIPASAGGLVIGRSGTHIRAMAEHSGAKVSLSQKIEGVTERVVTMAGQLGQCSRCLELLLETLQKEPAVARFTNLTAAYSAEEQQHYHSSNASHHQQQQRQRQQQRRGGYGSGNSSLSPVMPTALYTHSSNSISSSSYSHQQQQHPQQHFSTNGGGTVSGSSSGSGKMVPSADAPAFFPENVLQLQQQQQQQLLHMQQQQQQFVASATAAGQPYASAVAAAAAITTILLAIPDTVVGAILGRGGNVINALQVKIKNKRLKTTQYVHVFTSVCSN
jgi:KH domain